MAKVISGTKGLKNRQQRQPVGVKSTGHPAAFRKIRCHHCKTGYAVQHHVDKSRYDCGKCGRSFKVQRMSA